MLDVLLVDDEPSMLQSVSDVLEGDGHLVTQAADGEGAVARLGAHSFDLVICDMRLPRLDGLGVFAHVRAHAAQTDFVFITAFGAVPEAVQALKEGATDYLTKPFRLEELRARVSQIFRARELRRELAWARTTLANSGPTRVVGQSPAWMQALGRLPTFAESDYPVLITGESGTGKELVARMLHEQSGRRTRPLVTLNCAALPESLFEAELFGYRRGAFTGAVGEREGRFRAAHGGTLFLDEVAEIPLASQAKLLRVLQEGTFEPLGSDRPVKVDVRIVSATHRDLRERVASGQFREDLFYRLKVLIIEVPPLRKRVGDVVVLTDHFLTQLGHAGGASNLQAAALAALKAYLWPGNVRELEHALQHASVLARQRTIEVAHLPNEVAAASEHLQMAAAGAADPALAASAPLRTSGSSVPEPAAAGQAGGEPPVMPPLAAAMDAFERQYLLRALAAAAGKKTQAAAILHISRKGLWQKLRRHGLAEERRSGP